MTNDPQTETLKKPFHITRKLDKQQGSACVHYPSIIAEHTALNMQLKWSTSVQKTSQTYHSQYHSSASMTTSTDLQLSAFHVFTINQSNKRSISPEFPLCLQKIPGLFTKNVFPRLCH